MIGKDAIKKYIEQQMEDWDWIKKVPRDQILKTILEANPHTQFKTKPFTHQLVGFLIALYAKQFLFFMDMGIGKSKVCIDVINELFKTKHIKQALVLVPNVISVDTWAKEFELHSNLKFNMLIGNRETRFNAIDEKHSIYIINYQGLLVFNKNKKSLPIFDLVVYDESHNLRHPKTKTYKICKQIAANAIYRYGLTGTPFGRDVQDLWAQFNIIDEGETLGNTLTIFRQAFFDCKIDYWGGYSYTIKDGMIPLLHQRIKNRSIRYADTEVSDLPERTIVSIPIAFSKEQLLHYRKAVRGLIEAKGNIQEIDNAFVRMRMICSGYIQFRNDAEEKICVIFEGNPKLNALIELLQEMPKNKKAVVFHDYIKSGEIINSKLNELKINNLRLYGETKNKGKVKDEFINNPDVKVLVANSNTAGLSLNLQVANYGFFFESPVSPIIRKQAEKRQHRTGQTDRVFLYDLIMLGSVEEKILSFIKEGKNLFKCLLENPEEILNVKKT